MAKRNGNGKKIDKKPTAGRDMPLPRTLPEHLKPYDTNNDGVLSEEERIAMEKAKRLEKLTGQMQKKRKKKMEGKMRRP